MPEWEPPGAKPVEDDWEPPGARIPVKAHSRAKRGRLGATIGGAIGGLAGKPIGALAGGLGAYPGGIGGAGLLGSAGEGIEQLVRGESLDPGQIGQAGAEQAAYETAGGLVAKGAKLGGKFGINLALKFTPEIAQTAIKEGITATGMGLKKLSGLASGAANAERKIVSAAAGQGVGWRDPVALGREALGDVLKQLEGAPAKERDKAVDLFEGWLRDKPRDMHPLNLLKQRQYYDNKSASFRAAKNIKLKVEKDVEDLWHEAIGNRARRALQEDIPAIVDPGAYQKLTGRPTIPSELQKLMAVVEPLVKRGGTFAGRATKRLAVPAGGAAIGGTAAALAGKDPRVGAFEGVLAGLALDPAVSSTLGILAQSPLLQLLLSQVPRGVGALAQE